MGTIIGSGIFLTTGIMAETLPSASLLLTVWAVGGLLTLAGALTFAELGAAMPEAGGQYVYMREAYGPLPAFLFGWICFLAYQTGSIAAVAAGFAEYLGFFVPWLGTGQELTRFDIGGWTLTLTAGRLSAVAAIIALTAVNVRALQAGSFVQNSLTAIKVSALVVLIVLGFLIGQPAASSAPVAVPSVPATTLLSRFGVALIAVLWAYTGWDNLNLAGGEVRNPGRTIPRALLIGTLAVAAIYLLTNAVYLYALPIPEMQGVTRVGEKAASALFGPTAGTLIAAAVLFSTLGAVNGVILTAARIYYAMARDGLFFASVARVHPRFHTPHVALWLQCAWACVLALSGTYDQLFTYVIVAGLVLWVAGAASVFTLRRTRPDLPRPYHVAGYPVMPALFIAGLVLIIINTAIERPTESLFGMCFLILGIPVYFFWSRRPRGTVA